MKDEERYEEGLKVRRKVLGDEYVSKSLAAADEFTQPLQDMVTRNCWGEVWLRDGLELKERSLINLSMIAALNRPHELKIHLRGALNNGITREQIREIFLQVGVYCGMPAALDAFRCAKEVFADMDKENGKGAGK